MRIVFSFALIFFSSFPIPMLPNTCLVHVPLVPPPIRHPYQNSDNNCSDVIAAAAAASVSAASASGRRRRQGCRRNIPVGGGILPTPNPITVLFFLLLLLLVVGIAPRVVLGAAALSIVALAVALTRAVAFLVGIPPGAGPAPSPSRLPHGPCLGIVDAIAAQVVSPLQDVGHDLPPPLVALLLAVADPPPPWSCWIAVPAPPLLRRPTERLLLLLLLLLLLRRRRRRRPKPKEWPRRCPGAQPPPAGRGPNHPRRSVRDPRHRRRPRY
mmetsp:Transcript_25306/g.73228  ORF Transcript_25306/g.73228 Transcript_25306/m.73228 type:complete len:269 (+) Transcript_25306:12-818(+)